MRLFIFYVISYIHKTDFYKLHELIEYPLNTRHCVSKLSIFTLSLVTHTKKEMIFNYKAEKSI